MHLRPIEHLENRKMHTQERQLTCFFCMLQLIYKKNGSFQNRTETEPNFKNPFRTSLVATFHT